MTTGSLIAGTLGVLLHRARRLVGRARTLAAAALILAATGCQQGPPMTESAPGLTSLSPGAQTARIVFYRPANAFLAALRPQIVVNDRSVGLAVNGSVFARDARPGTYTVSLAGREDEAIDFGMGAGQVRYFRIEPSFGLIDSHLTIAEVDAGTGQAEASTLPVLANPTAPQ